MKREETYCDICGKQMTEYTNGRSELTGVRLLVYSGDAVVPNPAITSYFKRQTSWGSSSGADHLHGKDFCCYKCFEASITKWLAEIKLRFEARE